MPLFPSHGQAIGPAVYVPTSGIKHFASLAHEDSDALLEGLRVAHSTDPDKSIAIRQRPNAEFAFVRAAHVSGVSRQGVLDGSALRRCELAE